MEWQKIEIEIAKNTTGQILIRKDGCIVGIKNIPQNNNIIVFFEVEIDLKKQQ